MKAKAYSQRISFGAAVMCALLLVTLCAQNAGAQSNTFPSSGNVGIGTTSPNTQLEVKADGSNTRLTHTTTSSYVGFTFYEGTTQKALFAALGSTSTLSSGANALQIWNFANGNMVFATNNTERMRLDSSGKLGIGTTTPGALLDIANATRPTLQITTPGTVAKGRLVAAVPNWLGLMQNVSFDGTNFNLDDTSSPGWAMKLDPRSGMDAMEVWRFSAGANPRGSGPTSVLMHVDGSGNVGIGTTTLDHRLQISGGAQDGIVLNASTYPEIRLDKSSTIEGYLAVAGNAGGYAPNTTTNSLLLMGTNNLHLISNSTIGLTVNTSGNVGIGTTGPQYKLDVAGNINSSATITGNNIVAKYQDVAEYVPSSEKLAPGTVVVLDATKSNQVIASIKSYDTRVAGVVSEQPGIALGERGANKVLVATTGRVRVKVDASRNPIHIGDLLVTSDVPGVAMKSEPINIGGRMIHMPGTLIGKALEPLASGSGEILVLLSLQ